MSVKCLDEGNNGVPLTGYEPMRPAILRLHVIWVNQQKKSFKNLRLIFLDMQNIGVKYYILSGERESCSFKVHTYTISIYFRERFRKSYTERNVTEGKEADHRDNGDQCFIKVRM